MGAYKSPCPVSLLQHKPTKHEQMSKTLPFVPTTVYVHKPLQMPTEII